MFLPVSSSVVLHITYYNHLQIDVTSGPLDMLSIGIPMKLLISIFLWIILQFTPSIYANDQNNSNMGDNGLSSSYLYMTSLLLILLINEIASTLIFISMMSFFSKVSDPNIGGCYMTLLNTLSNIGSKWPNSLSLYILPMMTFQICEKYSYGSNNNRKYDILPFSCHISNSLCNSNGGICNIELDGYTIQVVGSVIIGIIWLFYYSKQLRTLQSLPHYEWLVYKIPLSSTSSASSTISTLSSTLIPLSSSSLIHSLTTPNKHSD